MLELRERGHGERESGGFLLGSRNGEIRSIKAFLPYDIIDPTCLRGHIHFDGSKMDAVWKECRNRGLRVVADVHTHPFGFAQSSIDQANPMMPEQGHIGIIIPEFAQGPYLPGEIGLYEFRGEGKWVNHSAEGQKFFQLRRIT